MRIGKLSLLLGSLAATVGLVAAAPPPGGAGVQARDESKAPAPTAPEIPELTADNFRDTVKKGYWFVKGYSPSCPHCKAAAPKWKALADYYTTTPVAASVTGPAAPGDSSPANGPSFTETYDFHFANLNCIAYGDLCEELGVDAWPRFMVFKDGQPYEKGYDVFDGQDNELLTLTTFTEKVLEHIKPGSRPKTIPEITLPGETKIETVQPKKDDEKKEEKPKATEPEKKDEPKREAPKKEDKAAKPNAKPEALKKDLHPPNPQGNSIDLDWDTFQKRVMHSRDKWFIKFYAPWCGHCQHMAPAWAELGREMRHQLNIGEVNCDIESKLCKEMGIRGFPTIKFFEHGEHVEYDGLRGLGDLVSYAKMAVDSGVKEVDAQAFDKIVKAEDFEVAFLYFYDHATTSEDFASLDRLTRDLIGHAPLLKTSDTELAKRYRVTTFPKLMVLRDKRPTYYPALAPQDIRNRDKVLGWMKKVWLPVVPELSAANSHEIMHNRYVVLGILDRNRGDQFIAAKKELKEAALEFMDQRQHEEKNERKEMRDKKQLRIEEAEDRNDDRAMRDAKNMRIEVPAKKEVIFAWVDGVFWDRWIRNTYGIDPSKEHERIIINDEDAKHFWDLTVDNGPITASRSRILETLKAVLHSPPKIKPKSSTGRMESIYYFFKNAGATVLWWFISITAIAVIVTFGRRRGLSGLKAMVGGKSGLSVGAMPKWWGEGKGEKDGLLGALLGGGAGGGKKD